LWCNKKIIITQCEFYEIQVPLNGKITRSIKIGGLENEELL
jgi:hypothetical protein